MYSANLKKNKKTKYETRRSKRFFFIKNKAYRMEAFPFAAQVI